MSIGMATRQTTTLLQKDLDASGQLLDVNERERIFSTIAPKARQSRTSSKAALRTENVTESKPIREFIAWCIHALLFNTIHIIFSVMSAIRFAYGYVIQRALAMRYYLHRTPALIQKDVKKLPKVPRHLSIILDGSGAAQDNLLMAKLLDEVCECAAWAACAGIQVLSIYERHGMLRSIGVSMVHSLITAQEYSSRLSHSCTSTFLAHLQPILVPTLPTSQPCRYACH